MALTYSISTGWGDLSSVVDQELDLSGVGLKYETLIALADLSTLSSLPISISSNGIVWASPQFGMALNAVGLSPANINTLGPATIAGTATGIITGIDLTYASTPILEFDISADEISWGDDGFRFVLYGDFPNSVNDLVEVLTIYDVMSGVPAIIASQDIGQIDGLWDQFSDYDLTGMKMSTFDENGVETVFSGSQQIDSETLKVTSLGYELYVTGPGASNFGGATALLESILLSDDLATFNFSTLAFQNLTGLTLYSPQGDKIWDLQGSTFSEPFLDFGIDDIKVTLDPGDMVHAPALTALQGMMAQSIDVGPTVNVLLEAGSDIPDVALNIAQEFAFLDAIDALEDYRLTGPASAAFTAYITGDYADFASAGLDVPDEMALTILLATEQGSGHIAFSDSTGQLITLESEVVFAPHIDFEGDVHITGTDASETVTILSRAQTLHAHMGAGYDVLDVSDMVVSLNGQEGVLTLDLMTQIYDLTVASDGNLTLYNTVVDAEVGVLSGVDALRVTDNGQTSTLTIDTVLSLFAPTEPQVINGTGAGESLTGTIFADVINGYGGADWITAAGGSDTIDGGNGRDMLSFATVGDAPGRSGGQYRLTIDMENGTAHSPDKSEYISFQSIERLTGSIYLDLIRGSDGDDQIRALGDYDWIIATGGNDTIDGGTGQDMLSFLEWTNDAPAPVTTPFDATGAPPSKGSFNGVQVDLANPENNTGLAAGHTLISIERITGSSLQDVFWGDDASNVFRGMGGYDWFVGSDGGRERYWGGAGQDTVTYFTASAGVTAHLSNGKDLDGMETGFGAKGQARKDLYFSIENLVGSAYGDHLTGGAGRNDLSGLDGDDMIFGLGGRDNLMGGAGNDTLDGGAGSDTAIFDGDLADYTLTRTGLKDVTIIHADGTDLATNVEYFAFDDQTVDVWSLDLA